MDRTSSEQSTTTASTTATSDEKTETVETTEKAPVKETKPEVRKMGGMVQGKWSGLDHWKCPKCGFTTLNEIAAKTHTCKGRAKPVAAEDKN